jgi:hypothetical protein
MASFCQFRVQSPLSAEALEALISAALIQHDLVPEDMAVVGTRLRDHADAEQAEFDRNAAHWHNMVGELQQGVLALVDAGVVK